ncbi:hypothetical protein [Sedimentitalea sp.]|uniref:hypothetical protein n=1 Tax=Sedimentitalea sp. TaxID=2048915 RepID=UPI00329A3379
MPKIGFAPQILNEWAKKVEDDTGQCGGIKTEPAETMKDLERNSREWKQTNEINCKAPACLLPLSSPRRGTELDCPLKR